MEVVSDDETQTLLPEVLAVLDALQHAGCRVWVGGGWGVDALVGRQTRAHRDLDLAVNAEDEARALQVLQHRGYVVETDWRPVRIELVKPGAGRVDLHPVSFDTAGHGRQPDLAGGVFHYPATAFTTGRLGEAVVGCLSREQQQRFHQGYELRPADVHDLRVLNELAGPFSQCG
jgi:lincosamide nucleotidyltransferase A/C/D/E